MALLVFTIGKKFYAIGKNCPVFEVPATKQQTGNDGERLYFTVFITPLPDPRTDS
jgi:hypothetical protein